MWLTGFTLWFPPGMASGGQMTMSYLETTSLSPLATTLSPAETTLYSDNYFVVPVRNNVVKPKDNVVKMKPDMVGQRKNVVLPLKPCFLTKHAQK